MSLGFAERPRGWRRIAPAMTIGVLMALASGCTLWSDVGPESEPLRFIVMADPQFGMTAAAHEGIEGFGAETALFSEAIEQANRLQPHFVVICGDLINQRGDAEQTEEFFRIAGQLDPDIPLHLVAGNHDVDNAPTPETLEEYRQTFGPDWYSFDEAGCHFTVINSCLIGEPERAPDEARRQMDWLRQDLAESAEADHRIIFMHHPICLADPAEEDSYFVLPMARRAPLLALLHEHDVAAVFNGHYHRNAEACSGSMELVTSAPVGMPIGEAESGFRMVEMGPEGLTHEFWSFESMRNGIPAP